MSEAAGGFAESAKSGLTSKIGGVPFYVYGIGFVAAFWAYKHFVAAKKVAPPVVTQDLVHPGGLPSVAGDTSGSNGLGPSSGFVTGSSGGVNGSNTVPGQLDATTWVNQATAYLASVGYDGTKANQYLNAYASGVQPTGEAKRYVQLALQVFGSPTTAAAIVPTQHTIVRLVAPANSPAAFAQWEDGTLHLLQNASEASSVVASNKNLQNPDGTAHIDILPKNDPIFTGADYGPGMTAQQYQDQVVATYQNGNPDWVPYWATPEYIAQHYTQS